MASHVFPIMFDAWPSWLSPDGAPASLLTMPCGACTLGAYLHRRVVGEPMEVVRVLPDFDPWPGYEEQLRRRMPAEVEIVTARDLRASFDRSEPSDWLLFLDPRYVPIGRISVVGLLPDSEAGSWQTRHFIVLNRAAGGTQERAILDDRGRVQRIQRYYDGFTHMQARGAACSLVPITSARRLDAKGVQSSMELRAALAAAGAPSSDIPMECEAIDLSDERGLLDLNSRILLRGGDEGPEDAVGALESLRGRIHSSAIISGPVVVREGATIEEDAQIIGPTVIGAGAVIGRNSIVAQCVVIPNTKLAPETIVRQRVVNHGHPAPGRLAPEIDRSESGHWRLGAPGDLNQAPADAPTRRPRTLYSYVKRATDSLFAATVLLVASPLLLIVGALVKLTSPGPVLFGHAREGRGGKVFQCYKFRSMVADADKKQRAMYSNNQVDGPQFKMDTDPRVTRVGHILRMTNIDEIPQLINVFLGQMSLIGPRPSPFRENQICVPWRKARLSVRPGITGLWQVCRHSRHAADFHQWIHYDMLYVKHFSFWLDAKIAIATVLTLGGRRHAPLERIIPPRILAGQSRPRSVRLDWPIFDPASDGVHDVKGTPAVPGN